MNSWSHDCKIQVKLATEERKKNPKKTVLRWLKVFFKVAVNTPGEDLTEKILPLTPKSKIRLISTSAQAEALISHRNTHRVFTSGRQRGLCEYFMKDLFEILNDLKLVHDFINGA